MKKERRKNKKGKKERKKERNEQETWLIMYYLTQQLKSN